MQPSFPGLTSFEELSAGPARVLWKAEQSALGRGVLVVGLAPGVRPDGPLGVRLRREADAYARLEHEVIPRLYDFQERADSAWLVLGPSGVPLTRRFDLPLPWQVGCALGSLLASALAHAHERGVVHGRLGLEHVMWTEPGRVHLLGFGLLPESSDEIEPIEGAGAHWFAPETALGQPPSPSADVFALGALLFEVIGGRTPFPPHGKLEGTPSLLALAPRIPAELEQLVRRCLSRLPGKRPESMNEVQQALDQLLGEPAMAVLERHAAPTTSEQLPHGPRGRGLARRGWGPGLRWGAAGLAVLAATAVGFRLGRRGDEGAPHTTPDLGPTEKPLLLRAVATPWAHVVVDGVRRETTPFAHPIQLPPGRHEIRFEHPQARPEVRQIEGAPGESVFLDVSLRVERPPPSEQPQAPPDESP